MAWRCEIVKIFGQEDRLRRVVSHMSWCRGRASEGEGWETLPEWISSSGLEVKQCRFGGEHWPVWKR